jgi:outer membrane protein assembly factor BamB
MSNLASTAHGLALLGLLAAAWVHSPSNASGDEPLAWSSRPGRNAASSARRLPTELTDETLAWRFRIRGGAQFTIPTTDGDNLLIGGMQEALPDKRLARLNPRQGGGSLICFEARTGEVRWQMLLAGLGKNLAFYGGYGTCNTPVIDGNRVYVVDPAGHLLCLDLAGQTNGNDGPFTDELRYVTNPDVIPLRRDAPFDGNAPAELQSHWGDILWTYEFLESEQVAWKHCFSGTMVIDGDLIYLPTSNSQHCLVKQGGQPHNAGYGGKGGPEGHPIGKGRPGLLVVDKRTGRLVARACSDVPGVYHGQWASPAMGVVNGRKLVFLADGYGILHAYAALDSADALGDEVGALEEVWRFDCVPPGFRKASYGKLQYTSRRGDKQAPCRAEPLRANVIAAPVFYEGKVYVSLGRDHNYGISPGILYCLDADGQGARGDEAVLWAADQVATTMCAVAVADGLVYYVDSLGNLRCFEADSGEEIWVHDLQAGVYYCEPLVADGKIYITTEREHVILKAGRSTRELFRTRARGAEGRTMGAIDGMLFVPTNMQLSAYRGPSE